MLMLGFEPPISGVGSNRSANCGTTMALVSLFVSKPNSKHSRLITQVKQQWARVAIMLMGDSLRARVMIKLALAGIR